MRTSRASHTLVGLTLLATLMTVACDSAPAPTAAPPAPPVSPAPTARVAERIAISRPIAIHRWASGSTIPSALTVRVTDVEGRPVAGARVVFSVSSGGVELRETVSDVLGLASPGRWTLGAAVGVQTLTARIANGAAVSEEIEGVIAGTTSVDGGYTLQSIDGRALPIALDGNELRGAMLYIAGNLFSGEYQYPNSRELISGRVFLSADGSIDLITDGVQLIVVASGHVDSTGIDLRGTYYSWPYLGARERFTLVGGRR